MAIILNTSTLAHVFHKFPHVDFNFHNTTTIFSPDDASYQQALLFNGIYLLFIAVCLFLTCSIYFLVATCYFCGECSKGSLAPRPARAKCYRVLIGVFALMSGLCLGIAFYGNNGSRDGVEDFSQAAIRIYGKFDFYEFMINDVILSYIKTGNEQIKSLTSKIPVAGKFLSKISLLLSNVQNDLKDSGNLLNMVGVNLKIFADKILYYDNIRWWTTLMILCFHILLVLVIFYTCYTKNKCGFIVLTVMSILSLLFIMMIVNTSVPLSIAAADICVHPREAYIQNIDDSAGKALATYYLECYNTSSDFLKPYIQAKDELKSAEKFVTDLIQNVSLNDSYPDVKVLLSAIQNSTTKLNELVQMVDCQAVHKEYKIALNAVCNTTLNGFGLLILSGVLVFFFLIAILFCITPLWKAITPLRPILKKTGVHLVTDSYQGPPGVGVVTGSESFHGSSSFDLSYKSIEDGEYEQLPLISKPHPSSYRSVQSFGSTEFLSVEEESDDIGKIRPNTFLEQNISNPF